MGTRSILLYGALLAALIGCAEDTTEPRRLGFDLEVTVVDATGEPMEGMAIQVHAPVLGVDKATGKRLKTTLPIAVPVSCDIAVTVREWGGEQLGVLTDAMQVAVGQYQIQWDVTDEQGEPVLGTVPIEFEFIARSVEDGEIIFRDTTLGLIYTSQDVAQQPRMGKTNADGKLRTTDRSFFPHLLELPEIDHVNFEQEIGGPIRYSETVEIVAVDPDNGEWIRKSILLQDAPNELKIRWIDPNPPSTELAKVPALHKDIDIPPGSPEFRIGPVFPNPIR